MLNKQAKLRIYLNKSRRRLHLPAPAFWKMVTAVTDICERTGEAPHIDIDRRDDGVTVITLTATDAAPLSSSPTQKEDGVETFNPEQAQLLSSFAVQESLKQQGLCKGITAGTQHAIRACGETETRSSEFGEEFLKLYMESMTSPDKDD